MRKITADHSRYNLRNNCTLTDGTEAVSHASDPFATLRRISLGWIFLICAPNLIRYANGM